VLLTTHPLLVPRSWKGRVITLPTLWTTPDLQREHFTFNLPTVYPCFLIRRMVYSSCWIHVVFRVCRWLYPIPRGVRVADLNSPTCPIPEGQAGVAVSFPHRNFEWDIMHTQGCVITF